MRVPHLHLQLRRFLCAQVLGQSASTEGLCLLQALDDFELEFEGLSREHVLEAVPAEGEDEADAFDPSGG